MAPTSPARITCWVTSSSLIMPLPIVLATWVPSTKAATKLKNAAQATALLGDSTRVETTVAIEFAASWKPFRKSNASATRMMKATSAVAAVISSVLDDDVAHDVRVVLALVAGVLEPVVDLLPLHDLEGIAAVGAEEVGDDLVVEHVGPVLQLRDADDRLLELPLAGQVPDALGDPLDLGRHLDQDLGEFAQLRRGLGQLEIDELLGHPLDVVEDVVEVGGEGADVLAVEGGNEGGVQGVEDLPGDGVPVVLQLAQLGHAQPPGRQVGPDKLGEQASGPEQVLRIPVEQLVEPLLLRHQPADEGVDLRHPAPSFVLRQ